MVCLTGITYPSNPANQQPGLTFFGLRSASLETHHVVTIKEAGTMYHRPMETPENWDDGGFPGGAGLLS